ncbi:MAG TPA: DNA adenine methylase [Candidatus Polarisedimenticolia bacterium]|jgi:DNA adenine methylase
MAPARPFLKWAGGKTQLLAQFSQLYPRAADARRFIEPFVGSGAVYFHVGSLLCPDRTILADDNSELINVYRVIQGDVGSLIRQLRKHKAAHSRDHYYAVRARDPGRMGPAARAARTIYLNRTCFNGLYRVNSGGGFNVPMGNYKDPPILDEENLRAVNESLARVLIRAAHFRETLRYARAGDFVYFDPPYHPISTTSYFTSYTRGSFGPADQEELAEVYARLAARGCRVMLSNSDCPFIRDLYRGFDVRTAMARRSINSNAGRRGKIAELVVLSYDPPSAPAAARVRRAPTGSTRASRPAPRSRPGEPRPPL